jgi:hypothetical protein
MAIRVNASIERTGGSIREILRIPSGIDRIIEG